ncbi:hypothetical protein TNCV_2603831 [Trichonephila clavipes]|nr:hypothetical protein TNCV_2603831 [Trichonephila clavipes]
MLQKERPQNSFPKVRRITVLYNWASNEDQRGPVVKRNGTPDHNSWLRAYVAYNSENRIKTLTCTSRDTSSMIVRTQLEAEFVSKHYTSPVSMIPT